jgi:uncharacterized membrane protein YdbT with pleckstrin-like domain
MASYVESVLAPGERIVHRASLSHWRYAFSYLIGALLIFGGLTVYVVASSDRNFLIASLAVMGLGLLMIVVALIRRHTTELVLTDRRIITKRGFVSRDTVEMNLGKIESLHVSQGLLGRILGYGDVTVIGTGSSLEPLRGISRPLELRRKLGEVAQPEVARAPA